MKKLIRHHEFSLGRDQNWSQHQHQVEVSYQLKNLELHVHFQVETKENWVTSPKFGPDGRKNWGLWEYDVVECFIRPYKGQKPLPFYVEVQLSPLNQPFQLIITKPRVSYYTPLYFEMKTSSQVEDKKWKASFILPMNSLGEFDELYGNFTSCLGKTGEREYFGLSLNKEANPDFHRFELFNKL